MEIATLTIVYLIYGTSLPLANGRELVTDEFLQDGFQFDCQSTEVNWIIPCNLLRRYFMIFDSQGNFFREATSEISNRTYLVTSFTKKAKKPTTDDVLQGIGYPDYLLQLERVDNNPDTFFIATKSGQLLIAGTEVNPILHLREDHCSQLYKESKIQGNSNALNLDYSCDQAHWNLWKVDERFLLIESVNKSGFYLNVESGTHIVRLGDEEKMTGIRTSFLKNITLEQTAGQGEPGIADDAYGDLVVHYFRRNGSQEIGYVCDYEWTQGSANAICTYLKVGSMSIPTYDGQYSNTTTPQYTVSGLQCKNENLDDCNFRTVCHSTSSCLAQKSMKAFGGTGYACNRGSSTDVAGVICGNRTQIDNLLKEKITCNRTSELTDRRNIAGMFSIQQQIKKVKPSMFKNKHWSQYLLPIPMAVSLMSALLLVSAQNDRVIELAKPLQGHWNHLKYPYLNSNLVFLSNNLKDSFFLSNINMGDIKQNAVTIHKDMRLALQYAFSSDKYDYTTGLTRKLNSIAENAKMNEEMANQVNASFTITANIIGELIEGLQHTQDYQTHKKQEVEQALNQTKEAYERDETRFEVNLMKKQKYDANVNKSRKAFFDAARAAMNAQCVDSTIVCEDCTGVLERKTDKCLKWIDFCTHKVDVCTGGMSQKRCLKYRCARKWFGDCVDHRECEEWTTPSCLRREMVCDTHERRCDEYEYEQIGTTCQDKKNRGKTCTSCTWIDGVSKSLEKVADITFKMQNSVMHDEKNYYAVTMAIEDLVDQVGGIDQDVQNYKKMNAASEIINATKNMNNESESSNLEIEEKGNINSTLKPLSITKLSVEMSINLLNQEKIPIAVKSRNYALEVKGLLESLIARNVAKVEEMTEKDKILITTLHTKGKEIHNDAEKEKRKHEISIEDNTPSGAIADHITGDLATEHLEYLSERKKTKKIIESLVTRMRNGIEEMFKQDFEVQDINSILTKLNKCSRYLSLLNQQWVLLQDFFAKMSRFLVRLRTDLVEMTDLYKELGITVNRTKIPISFKTELQGGIVDNLVNNIYVMRVAAYYTKIADDGLLQNMASLGLYSKKIEDRPKFDNLKRYIKDTALKIQEEIMMEVSEEEARMNDQLMNEVYSMKNHLACKLKDSDNIYESSKTASAILDINQKEKDKEKNEEEDKETDEEKDKENDGKEGKENDGKEGKENGGKEDKENNEEECKALDLGPLSGLCI